MVIILRVRVSRLQAASCPGSIGEHEDASASAPTTDSTINKRMPLAQAREVAFRHLTTTISSW